MSKLQHDRTPFWGSKLSPELKYLQTIITNKNDSVKLDRNSFRELLKTLYANPESSSEFGEKIRQLSSRYQISMYHLTMIHVCLTKLYRSAIRTSSIKQEIIKEDLVEFLKFPSEYSLDFSNLIGSQGKEVIERLYIQNCPKLVSLKSFNWRIDVSISTSSLIRNLEPSIIVEMVLSNGQVVSFSMSLNSFHLLRFNVAFVLKEIEDTLNKGVFKLAD